MISFDAISDPLPRRLADGLARLAAVARQSDWHHAEIEGLTPTQADILRFAASRPMGVRLSAAAAQAGVTKATASDAVSALERKRLMDKRTDPLDRRALALIATAEGHALQARWPASFESVVKGLIAAEQETLLRLVTTMIRTLQLRGLIAPQRTCVSCRFFRENATPGTPEPHYCAYVGAPMRDRHLRVDCPEHQAAA